MRRPCCIREDPRYCVEREMEDWRADRARGKSGTAENEPECKVSAEVGGYSDAEEEEEEEDDEGVDDDDTFESASESF